MIQGQFQSRFHRATRILLSLVGFSVAGVLVGFLPVELIAQEAPTATRLEMRHFWHVFIAYALAWIILLGWVISILKRFRRVEEKLD